MEVRQVTNNTASSAVLSARTAAGTNGAEHAEFNTTLSRELNTIGQKRPKLGQLAVSMMNIGFGPKA